MGVSNLNRILEGKAQRAPGSASQDYPEHGYVEVDFGPKPVHAERFTVYDDRVRTSTRIIARPGFEAGTGKDLDETEMDTLMVIAGNARTGSFEMYIRAVDECYLHDTFIINYTLINSDDAASTADDMLIDPNEL
jgi:hypothetical protein